MSLKIDVRNRWTVLTVFSFAAAMSQALWLNFAPLILMVETRYHVSEARAGLLLLVFPLVYVLFSIPAGRYIDLKGYRKSLVLGGLIMSTFSVVRLFDSSFWSLLVAQVGIAFAQPFVINSISKLVLDWFEKDQEAIATGIGTAGMFIGMALGMMMTPLLVEATSFRTTMLTFAILSFASFLLTVIFMHPRESVSVLSKRENISPSFTNFFRDRNLVLIFTLAFLGLGFFNGLTTWLEPILAPHGINSVQAGIIGGMLIIGGIFGAAIVPAISDIVRRRKPFLVTSIVIATGTVFPLCNSSSFHTLFILATIQGFFFLPAFSLLLQMCAEHVGEASAGIATGILMLLGNAGGVAVIVSMEAVKSQVSGFTPAVYLMCALLVISIVASLFISETHPSWIKHRPSQRENLL